MKSKTTSEVLSSEEAVDALVDRIVNQDVDDSAFAFIALIDKIADAPDSLERENIAIIARNRAYSRTRNFHQALNAFNGRFVAPKQETLCSMKMP